MKEVSAILRRHGTQRDACINVLQDIQKAYGHLPAEALRYVVAHSRITGRQIYGVATFYERFRFKPAGKHMIRTCHGTACHVNGARHTSRAIEETLDVKSQDTTEDGLFTFESVACLGCCSLAPVMMIDEHVYGRMTPKEMRKILREHQCKAGGGGKPKS